MEYNKIIEEARNSWSGETGDRRAESVKNIIDTRLENYSFHTGLSKDEILNALENKRNYSAVNFYQETKLPLLEDGIIVLDSLKEFKDKFPSGKSTCPSCGKESTDYYECSQYNCDWKVYGLLGDLGKGIKVIIKDKFLENPVPINIFKPIELKQRNQ